MMAKFAELIGQAIFSAFLKWAGVKDLDELLARGATAIRTEFGDDVAKIDAVPEQIIAHVDATIAQVLAQVTALPGQVLTQLKGWLPTIPGLPNIFG